MMKNRENKHRYGRTVTAAILSLALIFTMIPFTGYAASSVPQAGSGNMPAHAIRLSGSDINYYKEQAIETLNEEYDDAISDRADYCAKAWDAIQETYKAEMARISKAKKITDLFIISGSFLLPNEQANECYALLDGLGKMTKKKVRSGSSAEIAKMKKAMTAELNKSIRSYRKSSYNDFYWDVFQDTLYEIRAKISRTASLKDCVLTSNYIGSYFGDEDGDTTNDNLDDEDYTAWLYTKKQIASIRRKEISGVKLYVNRQLKLSKYTKATAAVRKSWINSCSRHMAGIQDAQGIVRYASRYIDGLTAKTGVEFEDITSKQYKALKAQLDALFTGIDKKKYSKHNMSRITSIVENSEETLKDAEKYAEVYDIVSVTKARISKVPTIKEQRQLARAKKAAISSLNKFKNHNKYNQYKARPLIKKGVQKIRRCTSVKRVHKVYIFYRAKLMKTKW